MALSSEYLSASQTFVGDRIIPVKLMAMVLSLFCLHHLQVENLGHMFTNFGDPT